MELWTMIVIWIFEAVTALFVIYGLTRPDFEKRLMAFEDRQIKKVFKNYSGRDLGK